MKNILIISKNTGLKTELEKTGLFKNILVEAELKIEDFENMTLWFDYLERKVEGRKQFIADNAKEANLDI